MSASSGLFPKFGNWASDSANKVGKGSVGKFFRDPYGMTSGGRDKKAEDMYGQAVDTAKGYDSSAGMGNSAIQDPRAAQAQQMALGALQGRVNAGGLDAQDQARMGQIQSQNANVERGQREALVNQAQAMGQGGSGAAFASQLANQQGSANRLSQQGMDVGALAQQSKMQAIGQLGQMGNEMSGQQIHRNAAQDAMNQFNAQGRAQQAGMVSGAQAAQGGSFQNEAKGRRDFFGNMISATGQGAAGIAAAVI